MSLALNPRLRIRATIERVVAPELVTQFMGDIIHIERISDRGGRPGDALCLFPTLADNPQPGAPPIEFPSLQIIRYAGDGTWASEEDWWILREMKRFNEAYGEASRIHDPDHKHRRTRLDWGDWVAWARPATGVHPTPSWVGRDDVTPIGGLREMTFGERTQ